jgi:hypothetical protein
MGLIRLFWKFIRKCDKFESSVGEISMAGHSSYKTKFGGICGLTIYCLIAWFVVNRVTRLVNRDDASVSQVTQSMNLMAADAPAYNLAENHFTFGFNILGEKIEITSDSDDD